MITTNVTSIYSQDLSNVYSLKDSNGKTIWYKTPNIPDYFCLTAKDAGSTVKLSKIGSPKDISLQYSTDMVTWSDFEIDKEYTLTNFNDKIYLKSSSSTSWSTTGSNYYTFIMSGKIKASGKFMSLLNFADSIPSYCFKYLFDGCTSLFNCAEMEIDAKTIGSYVFTQTFQNCSELIKAPIFKNIESVGGGAFTQMFLNCSKMLNAPALPATSLSWQCYARMFQGCSSLKKAPALPATTLASSCYQNMFNSCTSLTEGPVLPASSLVNSCYNALFANAININWICCLSMDTLTSDNAGSWCNNISSTGVFVKHQDSRWTDDSLIPSGWKIIYYDPDNDKYYDCDSSYVLRAELDKYGNKLNDSDIPGGVIS